MNGNIGPVTLVSTVNSRNVAVQGPLNGPLSSPYNTPKPAPIPTMLIKTWTSVKTSSDIPSVIETFLC